MRGVIVNGVSKLFSVLSSGLKRLRTKRNPHQDSTTSPASTQKKVHEQHTYSAAVRDEMDLIDFR